MIVFMSPLRSNSTFSSLSIKIKLEKTFFNWSIITLSRLSKVNQHLASHKFVINQVYQIRRDIWQDIKYNFTESGKSKLGEKETVMYLYVFGWCICQNCFLFYIWTLTELLYKHQSMFWIYGSFDIVTIIFCHSYCIFYPVLLYSYHPCDLTLIFKLYH